MTETTLAMADYIVELTAGGGTALIHFGPHKYAVTSATKDHGWPGTLVCEVVTGATLMIDIAKIDAVIEGAD